MVSHRFLVIYNRGVLADKREVDLWRFTSFLAEQGWSKEITPDAYIGFAALLVVMVLVLKRVEAKCHGIHQFNAIKPMAAGMLLCLGLCLGTQAVGRQTFKLVADAADSSEKSKISGRNVGKGLSSLAGGGRNRSKIVIGSFVVACLLFILGGGYAFTSVDLPLWGHMLAFTLGVGFTEELCKVAVAILLLHPLIGIFSHRKSLLPYILAGLAFGVAESFIYFQDYLRAGCGLSIYLVRAFWCVLLHVSWTMIVGRSILREFKETPTFSELCSTKFFTLLWLILPVAAIHGIYDALCVHEFLGGMFFSGAASLVFAYLVFDAYQEPGRKGSFHLSDVT